MYLLRKPLLITASLAALTGPSLMALDTAAADKALQKTSSVLNTAPVLSQLDGHIEVGFGYDSNPYLTPTNDYVDYSPAVDQNITTDRKSGFFTPVDIGLNYHYTLSKQSDLFAQYDFDGRLYYGSDMQNATRYTQKIKGGLLYKFTKSKKRKHQLTFALLGADHYETYVDRDNGEYKNSSSTGTGTDIPERYRYRYGGIELAYERERKSYEYYTKLIVKKYDYEKADAWSELDYDYYKLALGGAYNFTKRFATALELSHYVKDYDSRPSYDADTLSLNYASPLYYRYEQAKVALKYKVKKRFRAKLGYRYTHRTDGHQGYNDYNYNNISADATYTFSPELHLDGSLEGYRQSYPNALAFDELGQSAKYFNGEKGDIALRYRYKKMLYLAAEFMYKQQRSSDKRYEYERMQTLVSAKMKF